MDKRFFVGLAALVLAQLTMGSTQASACHGSCGCGYYSCYYARPAYAYHLRHARPFHVCPACAYRIRGPYYGWGNVGYQRCC
jgi:hypothetical protein